MEIEVINKADLEAFRKSLLHDLAEIITHHKGEQKEYLRTKEVRQLLGISNGTISSLRIKGLLQPSKIEGVYYYKWSEIKKLLNASAG